MELLKDFVDLFLHLDRHLSELIARYGTSTYAILFLIIFCETGLVVTPFLPGDSLLFAAGTFAGLGDLNPGVLFGLLFLASVLGDSTNYWVGRYVGPRAFSGNIRFLKREYLDKTRDFYQRHGAQTVIVARFLPIIRTFAPFVAGVGQMTYARFLAMSLIGSAAWVGLFVGAGYFFGNLPVVRENFSLVVMAIIAVSLLPMALEIGKGWLARRRGS
ncbi:MAG TPA: DedA family protein [Gemmatimonadales bacterium]|nr:DedA family protein [Gemmatimonadales bacterium]